MRWDMDVGCLYVMIVYNAVMIVVGWCWTRDKDCVSESGTQLQNRG